MRRSLFIGTAIATGLLAGAASAQTLDQVKAADVLKCGTNTGLAGFAAPDAAGNWEGFDVDGLPRTGRRGARRRQQGRIHPHHRRDPLHGAASGEIDVLVRNSTWTFTRDVDLKFDLRRRQLL